MTLATRDEAREATALRVIPGAALAVLAKGGTTEEAREAAGAAAARLQARRQQVIERGRAAHWRI